MTGAGRSGDEEGLVEHEEIPETDYPDAPDISVTMVIEDAGPALPSPPPEPPVNPSAGEDTGMESDDLITLLGL